MPLRHAEHDLVSGALRVLILLRRGGGGGEGGKNAEKRIYSSYPPKRLKCLEAAWQPLSEAGASRVCFGLGNFLEVRGAFHVALQRILQRILQGSFQGSGCRFFFLGFGLNSRQDPLYSLQIFHCASVMAPRYLSLNTGHYQTTTSSCSSVSTTPVTPS